MSVRIPKFKKSRVDAILELTQYIVDNLEDNVGAACTLIDHTNAFDTVDHKILQEKKRTIWFTR